MIGCIETWEGTNGKAYVKCRRLCVWLHFSLKSCETVTWMDPTKDLNESCEIGRDWMPQI